MREHERTGDGDRRHGACQRERRDDEHLARIGEIDDAFGHRDVELQRRVRVDDGPGDRRRAELFRREPVRQAQQLEVVGNLAAAAREHERNLVGQQELRARHLQVANVHRDVLRLHGAT